MKATARRPDGRSAGAWLIIITLLAVGPSGRPAVAQVAANRSTAYLHPTDVSDARAVWVNPAGLAVQREASIYAEVNVSNPGARGQLQQINAGFNSRGLSFAYQRDNFGSGLRGHTYRLGLAGASGGLAAGFAAAYYRGGGAKATGWDVGLTYAGYPGLTLGGVITNIGQPNVRAVPLRLTFVPGFTWHPRPLPALGFSAHSRITPDSVQAYAFGLSWISSNQPGTRWPISVVARLDTDAGLRRGAFALGVTIGSQDRFGVVASTPGDVSRIDETSAYALSTREPTPGRRP